MPSVDVVGVGQILHVDHDAVDPANETRVVGKFGRLVIQQRLLVRRNRRVVGGVDRGIIAVETRIVVKDVAGNDADRVAVEKFQHVFSLARDRLDQDGIGAGLIGAEVQQRAASARRIVVGGHFDLIAIQQTQPRVERIFGRARRGAQQGSYGDGQCLAGFEHDVKRVDSCFSQKTEGRDPRLESP